MINYHDAIHFLEYILVLQYAFYCIVSPLLMTLGKKNNLHYNYVSANNYCNFFSKNFQLNKGHNYARNMVDYLPISISLETFPNSPRFS